jgi:hypothetical protein
VNAINNYIIIYIYIYHQNDVVLGIQSHLLHSCSLAISVRTHNLEIDDNKKEIQIIKLVRPMAYVHTSKPFIGYIFVFMV